MSRVERSQSPQPAFQPRHEDLSAMRGTIGKIQGMSLSFGAGHPPSFGPSVQDSLHLEELFHRKIS